MTIKTPNETAFDAVNGIAAARNASDKQVSLMVTVAIAAIEADRAQRTEIHEDWRDDQEDMRDSAYVDVSWTSYGADGSIYHNSDMRLTAAQAVGMFQGIGEASL